MLTLFLQVTGADWLWPMLPLSFKFKLVVVYAPNIAPERVPFFSSVGAVPGRFEAVSLNGRLECDP